MSNGTVLFTSHSGSDAASDPACVALGKARFKLRIHRTLDEAEPAWRNAEARLAGSVYQRLGFCRAYMNTIGKHEGLDFVAFELCDDQGAPGLFLPLAVKTTGAWRVGVIIGAKHTNFGMPLFDPAAFADCTGADIEHFLKVAAKEAGLDALRLLNMPVSWNGVAQPLALAGGQVSVNPAARANLDADPDATIRRLRGAKGAKQLRSKERKLAELGEVRFVTATTPEEQFRFLTAFLRQKAEWFEKRHMSDAFADQPTKDFFEAMIQENIWIQENIRIQENASSAGNIIDFHVLLLDGHPIALYSGAIHQKRLSLYTTSIVLDDEIGKSSPGELVLKAMIEMACQQGIEVLDLGVGSSETKRRWLPDEEPIIDMIRGYGAGGSALAHVMAQMQTIKRVIKVSPAMMSAVRKLRGQSA